MPETEAAADSRVASRTEVPRLYTLLRLRRAGEQRYSHTGQICDISLGGMRFTVDFDLQPGTPVEVRGMIPHSDLVTFRALGEIIHRGPDGTLGMRFDDFITRRDEQRLADYLAQRQQPTTLRLAA